MKKYFLPSVIFGLILVLLSFEESTQIAQTETHSISPLTDSTLDLLTAQKDIRQFGEFVKDSFPEQVDCDVPVVWTLKWEDLKKFKKEGAQEIRAYLSLKSLENLQLELILVGFRDGRDQVDSTLSNLIRPCPNTCLDLSSPLIQSYCHGMGKSNADPNCQICSQTAPQ